jgi:hypothetical protein
VLPDERSALRGFVARLIGFAPERAEAVEHALQAIELAASHRAPLVLLGDADLVRIAHALHRRALGAERPFVVCDPRRRNTPASARSPASYEDGGEAFAAADGGTLCVYRRRLSRRFSAVVAISRAPAASVQLVICGGRYDKYEALLEALAPIAIPSLQERDGEIRRIVEEYAADAAAAQPSSKPLTPEDRNWICQHCASSLREIEEATLRVVALRKAGNIAGAAKLLGMSHTSLAEWLQRRRGPWRDQNGAARRGRSLEPSPLVPRPSWTRGQGRSRRRPSR